MANDEANIMVSQVQLFNGIYKLGYVTADIQRSMASFRENYGIEEFLCQDVTIEMTTPDGPGAIEIRLGLAFVQDIQIELIQPLSGDTRIFSNALNSARSDATLHHVAIRIQGDLDSWSRFRSTIGGSGCPLAMEGAVGDDVRFAYRDERERLGHYVEFLWLSPAAELGQQAIPRF